MNTLTQRADELRKGLPKSGGGKAPEMKGILLGTLPHKDGEIRLSWDEYEGRHFLSVRLWTTEDGKAFWPSKTGFTIKVRDLPTLGDAISKALDLALVETKTNPEPRTATSRAYEGAGAPF